MIDPALDSGLNEAARALDVDWRGAWIGPADDGTVRAWPESLASALGVAAVTPKGALRLTSVLEPVRSAPGHRSESITELRGGEHLTGLLRREDWWLVVGEDGYVGWIHDWVIASDDPDRRAARVGAWIGRYARPLGTLWIADNHAGQPLVLGTPLLRVGADNVARGGWRLVATPTGTEGWLAEDEIETSTDPSSRALLRRARSLLGVPYRWGGRSPLGFDCSGFVQYLFALGGMRLPRDASQQEHVGEAIATDRDAWVAGDVLFFGAPADHVGVFDGKRSMIHCRASVVKQPLDDLAPLLERLSGVRRVTAAQTVATATLWLRPPDATPDATPDAMP